jgi:hypothetical protein
LSQTRKKNDSKVFISHSTLTSSELRNCGE